MIWRGWGASIALASFVIWAVTSYLVVHEGILAGEPDSRRDAVAPTVAGGFVLLAGIVINLFFRLTPVPSSEGEEEAGGRQGRRPESADRDAEVSDGPAGPTASDSPSVAHTVYFVPVQFWSLGWWGLAAYKYFEIAGAWKVIVPVGLVLVLIAVWVTAAEGAGRLPPRRIRPASEVHDEDAAAADAAGIEVVRVKASWLRRVFAVTTPDGTYEVEFNGRRTGEDSDPILVDGRTQSLPYGSTRHGRRYRFRAGPTAGFIDIRTTPWMTLRSVRVCVGGRVLYSEWKGEAGARPGG